MDAFIENTINQLLSYQRQNETRKAIFFIYRWVDEQFEVNNFNGINELFSTIDISQFGEDILVGLITATGLMKHFLPERQIFINASLKHLATLISNEAIKELEQQLIR